MLVLSLVAIATLVASAFGRPSESTIAILQYADAAVCILFFIDFLVTLARAPNRRRYFVTWGWVDRARIDNDHRHNVYVGRNSTEIGALPSYDHNSIQRLLHGSTATRPTRGDTRGEAVGRDRESRMTLSEEELVTGKRKVAAGEVMIDKKVEHDRVHQKR